MKQILMVGFLVSYATLVYAVEEHQHAEPAHTHQHQGAGGHGQHGMVAPESKHFPTLGYDDSREPRVPQSMQPPAGPGDPQRGKHLAYSAHKGRCLTCHVLGSDGEQPGTVGPNLSTYATRGITPAQTFQQIWDARVANPHSIMPAFGTFDLLTASEIADITAYLHTLTTLVEAPAPLTEETRGVWVAGKDLTNADTYLEMGEKLFRQAGHNKLSCASCHSAGGSGPDLKGVAATYPKWHARHERIVLLEQRINMCRMHRMDSKAYPLGSHESNVLLSYVKYLSRDVPVQVASDGPAAEALARGKQSFYRRTGQLNFACATCHAPEQMVIGKWLRGDVTQSMLAGGKYQTIATQWPKHFVGGHDLGLQSLQQRIKHCQAVTRSFPLALGSQEYVELELFLTDNANGAPMLAPTMTRMRGEE